MTDEQKCAAALINHWFIRAALVIRKKTDCKEVHILKLDKLKKELLLSIENVCQSPDSAVMKPGRDFTRNRKLPLFEVIRCIVAMGGSSMKHELLEILGYSPDTATSSAFIQQRAKLKPEALKMVMDAFNYRCGKFRKKKNLRVLAVDGSDIQIPTNPEDPETFFPGSNGQAPYNLLHLNALYDLHNQIYTDVRFGRNEHAAFVDMIDSSNIGKALVIADRGYESFNDMAHVQEKGWYFLIRVRDSTDNGIKRGFDLPSDDEFDMPVELNLTRKQTKSIKELLKDRNSYRFIAHTTPFDFLPARSRKCDPAVFYLLKFRIVRFRIMDELYETLLTNLPSDEYPLDKLRGLYNQRWGIETSFRSLKYTTGLLHLHSKKVACIKQEIYAKIIMYNFTEMVTSHVIIKTRKRKYIYKANFTIATHMCRMFLRNKASPPEVEAMIVRETVPVRPGRALPRFMKAWRTYICCAYTVS